MHKKIEHPRPFLYDERHEVPRDDQKTPRKQDTDRGVEIIPPDDDDGTTVNVLNT